MTQQEMKDDLKRRLGGMVLTWFEKSPRRIYVDVAPESVPEASRIVFRDLGARFQIASGVDTPTSIEILYHWAFDKFGFVCTVRTRLNRENPAVESIATLCKGAEWIEREMWELLGVTFRNHPDMRHLLLTDDWPADKFPLRRDFRRDDKGKWEKENA